MGAPVDPAITACGAITALGWGTGPLTQAILGNDSGLRALPSRLDVRGCPSNIAGAVPEEVWESLRGRAPEHADEPAFLLADGALQQVRPALDCIPGSRVGLVLSTTKADIVALERIQAGTPCSSLARRHILPGCLAQDLAVAHGIAGPVRCVSVACVSGLLAIQVAAELLQRKAADAVCVVGVDLLSRFVLSGFTSLKSLDPAGCRPFDKDRAGLSLGEGAGALVLAEGTGGLTLSGWGGSNDANHLTGPSRDGSGLDLAIRRALRRAGVDAAAIDYVHAHGTGTVYNDTMESLALRAVFGDRVPPFGSAKGMLGHTLGAAGILETILCTLAAGAGVLPGTPRLRERAADVPASILSAPRRHPLPWRVLKINSGFGGTNAALVMSGGAP